VVVLKGSGSLVANATGECWINPTGNPALAAPGMGDTLCGVVAGLVAQGLPALSALQLGVYIHGAAADALVARGLGPRGLTASELALEIRSLLNHPKV
jgi:NAD(P)H-hydrate repair Nnr-like enzyme with NAD(P)H-hydrate dehydratase domain